jgi:nicotinamide-nucleotide amidase
MALRAEILSIGDELTSGQRLDTNSQWLSEQLGNLGVKTVFHTTVGDSLSDNVDAFRTAARRADVVVATGGLGPTADDLTREAIAEAFDLQLEIRPEALEHIESLFARRKRPMPERNRSQAMFPVGARIIDNPHGTAPGVDLVAPQSKSDEKSPCRIFALPGVPAEMMQMFKATVEPRLMNEMGVGAQRWYFHSLKVFGIGESDVEKKLPDLIHRDRDPIVGITVSKATITLRIAALCSSESEFKEKIQPTLHEIHSQLGLLVFGEGEIDIDEAAHRMLIERGLSLGILEVGAGAWIQHGLAKLSQPGPTGLQASHWFPSMDAMSLGVNCDDTDSVTNGLSMAAEQFRNDHDLDLCLAAGTYPTWEAVSTSATLPSSDFSFALARRGKDTKCTTVSLGAHPDVLYHRLAKAGLNFLRLELLQHD